MDVQFEPSGRPPSGPQRSHWYANVMGSAPDHVPTLAVRARASVGVPVTEGSVVLSGGPVVVDFCTTSEGFDTAAAEPAEFDAMTWARRRLPTSAWVRL